MSAYEEARKIEGDVSPEDVSLVYWGEGEISEPS
jgi:hypothetical protein